jgi:hypothetical protein
LHRRAHPQRQLLLYSRDRAVVFANAPHGSGGGGRCGFAIEQEVFGANHKEVGATLHNLGRAQLLQQDAASAIGNLEAALAVFTQHAEQRADIGEVRFDLARACLLAKRVPEAKAHALAAAQAFADAGRSADGDEVREWLAALR